MKTFIAFLRGINVGGHKKILMGDLRTLLESEGLHEVQTYIQSGNVIFRSEASVNECERIILEAIKKKYNWNVPVMVKEPSDINQILDRCPFEKEKMERSYFTLLSESPDKDLIEQVQQLSDHKEEFVITNECIYFWSPNYDQSKFSNNFFERKLKVKSTNRNYRTMMKLIDLSS